MSLLPLDATVEHLKDKRRLIEDAAMAEWGTLAMMKAGGLQFEPRGALQIIG